MSEERVIRNLRHMAWERAQGELKSMLHTFWSGGKDEQYKELDKEITDFIARIKNKGLHE